MANDLVVQLGAKLDQFESDMNEAGNIADGAVSRIEQSFANLNPGLGGFGALATAAAGSVGAVTGLLAALASVNSELANIAEAAKYLNTTTDQVQKFQFAASSVGIGGSESLSGLQNVGKLLNDALVNENSLTKLLDENGVQYKDQAGKLITINQLLSAGADLVKNSSTYADKSVIAGMLGLTKEWVPLLDQGSAGFNRIADSAQDAGAVIDSTTIQRASEFDRQWKNSSESFSTYMKSALVDLLPIFDDLIERAAKLIKNLPSRSDIQAAADAQLKSLGDSTGTPESVAITVNADNLHQAIQDWQNSPIFSTSTWYNLGLALFSGIKAQSPEEASKTIPGYAASQIVEPSYPTEDQMNAAFKKQWAAADAAQDAEQDKGDVSTKIPSKKNGNDAADSYDRVTESVEKYTARLTAEADAQGQGAAATEEAKVQAQLLTAAQQSGIPITQKMRDEMQDLAQDAGDAADALAKAKVASDIKFGSKTALLNQQDLAIAQQLKGIYGNDIPAAMASSEAAALKLNATIKDLGTLGQQVNSGFLVDFETQIRNGASAMQALQTAGVNALGKIADKLADMAANNLWSAAFGGATGGAGSFFSNIFGSGSSSAASALPAPGSGAFIGPVIAATGGFIQGPGSSTSDSIPARLSNGEYVINAAATSKYKILLDSINSGKGFASGGYVGMPDIPSVQGSGGGTAITVHSGDINIQGSADQTTLTLMKQMLAQRDAELPNRIVQTVTKAKKQRLLT